MRWVWLALGILAVLIGAVWILQGLNVLGGSAMSGHAIFAVIGLIVGLIGVLLVVFSGRRGATSA